MIKIRKSPFIFARAIKISDSDKNPQILKPSCKRYLRGKKKVFEERDINLKVEVYLYHVAIKYIFG